MGLSTPTTEDHTSINSPPRQAVNAVFLAALYVISQLQRWATLRSELYLSATMILGASAAVWTHVTQYISDFVQNNLMASVNVRADDEVYAILMRWVAGQPFSQAARRVVANADVYLAFGSLWSWNDDDDDDDDGLLPGKQAGFYYTPAFGTHHFWYRGRPLMFRRQSLEHKNSYMTTSEREEVSLFCFGRSTWIIKELLEEARQLSIRKDDGRTIILRGMAGPSPEEPIWQRCLSPPSRPLSTIVLDENVKGDIINDIKEYLRPSTQKWYAERGIPWRRGYLLHGPTGTGKSSLSFALAGYFKLRLYILSLSSLAMTEEAITSLFIALPSRCIVLLEDVDTVNVTNSRLGSHDDSYTSAAIRDSIATDKAAQGIGAPTFRPAQSRLSLSCLLNVLDGVASQEGRILIMTTNHPDRLDEALLRPGRIDKTIEFVLANWEMKVTSIPA